MGKVEFFLVENILMSWVFLKVLLGMLWKFLVAYNVVLIYIIFEGYLVLIDDQFAWLARLFFDSDLLIGQPMRRTMRLLPTLFRKISYNLQLVIIRKQRSLSLTCETSSTFLIQNRSRSLSEFFLAFLIFLWNKLLGINVEMIQIHCFEINRSSRRERSAFLLLGS